MTQLSFNGWVRRFLLQHSMGVGVRWNCPSDLAVVCLRDLDGHAWLWSGPLVEAHPRVHGCR